MAPTPLNGFLKVRSTENPPQRGMNTGEIVGIAIFGFFLVGLTVTLTAFLFYRRAERNKLPPEKRPVSYHPFRSVSSSSTAKTGLLANAAPVPEDDDGERRKSDMFSRNRGSSLSLYVDTQMHHDRSKRASIDTVSLIPLHVTPPAADDDHGSCDPMDSVGSGVSSISKYTRSTSGSGSMLSISTSGSLGMSTIPVPEEGYNAGRKTRPRSTSATSQRYYEVVNGGSGGAATGIPKIVTTPSP